MRNVNSIFLIIAPILHDDCVREFLEFWVDFHLASVDVDAESGFLGNGEKAFDAAKFGNAIALLDGHVGLRGRDEGVEFNDHGLSVRSVEHSGEVGLVLLSLADCQKYENYHHYNYVIYNLTIYS